MISYNKLQNKKAQKQGAVNGTIFERDTDAGFFRAVDQRLQRKCCAGKGEADQQNKKDEFYFNVLHACLSFSLVA